MQYAWRNDDLGAYQQNAENICVIRTQWKLDLFLKGTKMRFVIENPPFETPGGKDAAEGEDAVNAEYLKGFDGR